MLKELCSSIQKDEDAIEDIFLLAEMAMKLILQFMLILKMESLNIQGLRLYNNSSGYAFNDENVNSYTASLVSAKEADTVYNFVKAYPAILQELTNLVIERHNRDLESSLKTLGCRMVECCL
jgi:hypothetical protein